jgi:hypothetical protein
MGCVELFRIAVQVRFPPPPPINWRNPLSLCGLRQLRSCRPGLVLVWYTFWIQKRTSDTFDRLSKLVFFRSVVEVHGHIRRGVACKLLSFLDADPVVDSEVHASQPACMEVNLAGGNLLLDPSRFEIHVESSCSVYGMCAIWFPIIGL